MKKRDFNREIFQFLVKYFEITYHLSYKNIGMLITSTSFFVTLYSPGIYITITSFSYNIDVAGAREAINFLIPVYSLYLFCLYDLLLLCLASIFFMV